MRLRSLRPAMALVLVLVTLAVAPGTPAEAQGPVRIEVLSNRADLISGDDAYVEILVPAGAGRPAMELDGRNISASFARREDGRILGIVKGLDVGDNVLTATLPDGSGARITITNHPIGGPVIAGPHVQPWVCATEDNGLGPAEDQQCNAPTVYEYRYKSSATGQFAAYDPDNPPADVATTTTDEGKTVPYVVRVERGTMDRGIYEVAVLFDPDQPWEHPWAPQDQWNNKLYWTFGGDCKPWHRQSSAGVGATAMHDGALSRGFAVATGGLSTLGTNCNDVVSVEHVLMLKEHIVEAYGEVRYTMSEGCSGGSMQQHWIAANYPGLLDGIQPSCSYPDIWETMQAAEDCHLMDRVFDQVSPHLWANPDDQAEAAGHAAATTCRSLWDNPTGEAQYARTWFDPDYAGGCSLDTGVVYNAETNPSGVRCTLQDYQVALWGRRPGPAWTDPEKTNERGFANRPFDNVGVQYGLAALDRGDILPAQFVDLNVNVGGIDVDWNYQPERSVADPAALQRAYLGGRITSGAELDQVPIMDIRGSSNLEIHTDVHTWVTRARIAAANGDADNHVSWNSPCPLFPCPPVPEESFELLDEWLAAVEADTSATPLEDKIVANKPERAVDGCWISGQFVSDMQQCNTMLPYYATPRLTAGAPMTDDVLKCRLKPLDRADYSVEFTDAQWAQMGEAFPDGVCDYSKPGLGQRPPRGPWQTYENGPDGRPLGAAPVSVPFGPGGDVCADAPVAPVVDRGRARVVHRPAVDCVIYTRISVGVSADRYGPQRPVSRGQMATFVVNTLRTAGAAAKLPPGSGAPEFVDIAGNVHARNINRLARADVVSGVGRGRFDPDAAITRAQMASFMVAAARLADLDLPRPGDHFADVRGAHTDSINTGYQAGLFTGTTAPTDGVARSGRFSPGRDILRDQMATFLVNLLQLTSGAAA